MRQSAAIRFAACLLLLLATLAASVQGQIVAPGEPGPLPVLPLSASYEQARVALSEREQLKLKQTSAEGVSGDSAQWRKGGQDWSIALVNAQGRLGRVAASIVIPLEAFDREDRRTTAEELCSLLARLALPGEPEPLAEALKQGLREMRRSLDVEKSEPRHLSWEQEHYVARIAYAPKTSSLSIQVTGPTPKLVLTPELFATPGTALQLPGRLVVERWTELANATPPGLLPISRTFEIGTWIRVVRFDPAAAEMYLEGRTPEGGPLGFGWVPQRELWRAFGFQPSQERVTVLPPASAATPMRPGVGAPAAAAAAPGSVPLRPGQRPTGDGITGRRTMQVYLGVDEPKIYHTRTTCARAGNPAHLSPTKQELAEFGGYQPCPICGRGQ